MTVGTSIVQLLVAKEARLQWKVIFPPSSKIAANTGLVYIGIGKNPVATAGNTDQGHIMIGGDDFGEKVTPGYSDCSKEAIYAIASASGQIVEVYEVTP